MAHRFSRFAHRGSSLIATCFVAATFATACGGDDPVAGLVPDRNGTEDTGGRGGRTDVTTQPDAGTDTPLADAGPDASAEDAATDADEDTGETDVAAPEDTGETDSATPDATTDTGGVDPATLGGVAGRVWAPGNAPGMVPTDQEIPISGALVYLTEDRPAPIPARAYCAACETPPARAQFSANDGSFILEGFPAGTYWLVIEKGQFRLEVEVEVTASTLTPLDAPLTTLPSRNDPAAGMTTPRIALAAGSYDHLEDIIGKMGLGDVDGTGSYVPASAAGVIDVWNNGGDDFGAATLGTLSDLVRDLDRMLDYHIIFIPCSGTGHTSALNDQAVLRNMRDYVAAGGNLYVTDWSGEWFDNVFPAQVELGGGLGGFGGNTTDTPASAYDPATNTWNTSSFGDADGSAYNTPNAAAVDRDLHAWLNGQVGPTAHSDTASAYDASYFEVEGNWNTIESVTSIEVGVDGRGDAIIDEPRVWVHGGSDSQPVPRKPLTVSFEPVGCGRVLYSTYHTTDDTHVGLAPQERVLLYLIMEIGTCRDPKL